MNKPKVIYFIPRDSPGNYELQVAANHPDAQIVYRNLNAVSDEPEDCDGVMGHVPDQYKNKSTVYDAVKTYLAEIEASKAPAPLPPAPPAPAEIV